MDTFCCEINALFIKVLARMFASYIMIPTCKTITSATTCDTNMTRMHNCNYHLKLDKYTLHMRNFLAAFFKNMLALI